MHVRSLHLLHRQAETPLPRQGAISRWQARMHKQACHLMEASCLSKQTQALHSQIVQSTATVCWQSSQCCEVCLHVEVVTAKQRHGQLCLHKFVVLVQSLILPEAALDNLRGALS